jgi:phage baseplate assembly protein W
MSTEIVVPFALATDGAIQTTGDPNVQAQQHLTCLLSTSPGERVMVATYGVPVKGTVFLPDDDIAVSQLQGQIQAAIATWEPNITVNTVTVAGTGDPEDPTAIDVDWSINQVQTGTASGLQTATILIGGAVIDGGVLQ